MQFTFLQVLVRSTGTNIFRNFRFVAGTSFLEAFGSYYFLQVLMQGTTDGAVNK